MEVTFGDAEGLLLFYLGEQINIIYRHTNKIFLGGEATLKLRNTAQMREGKISIYELPLDMAHMLRGLSNRKEIFGQIFAAEPLKDFIRQRHDDGHTGSLEILTNKGTGMILLVRGRFSTAYFETEGGVTFEKKEALNKIYALLERDDTSAQVFQSDFSPDIWKTRQQGSKGRSSRLQELLEQRGDGPAEPMESTNFNETSKPRDSTTARVVTMAEVAPPPEPPPSADRRPLQEQITLRYRGANAVAPPPLSSSISEARKSMPSSSPPPTRPRTASSSTSCQPSSNISRTSPRCGIRGSAWGRHAWACASIL